MKIAVVLTGKTDYWLPSFNSQMLYFGKDADFYLCSSQKIESNTKKKILLEYNPIDSVFGFDFPSFDEYKIKLVNNHYSPYMFLGEDFYEMHVGFNLIKEVKKYDIICISRFNSFYRGIFPYRDYKKSRVYTPEIWRNRDELNCNFACGGVQAMAYYSSLHKKLDETLRYGLSEYTKKKVLLKYLMNSEKKPVIADFKCKLLSKKDHLIGHAYKKYNYVNEFDEHLMTNEIERNQEEIMHYRNLAG